MKLTLIIPYYRAPEMLRRQMEEIRGYPFEIKIVVVDDGSPEPAAEVMAPFVDMRNCRWGGSTSLYRIGVDIPWNRAGARNLGAYVCDTEWLVHLDIDHILPAEAAAALVKFTPDPAHWYRFPRYRVGKADDTRNKDALPRDCEFGPIKPHIDSYLCTRDLYWKVGGYDEDYSGSLGGGSPFLAQLSAAAPMAMLEEPICLHVYTRSVVADSSISTLSRDTSRYSAMRKHKEATKTTRPVNPLRFEWSRVI